jgi:hypothetical protein
MTREENTEGILKQVEEVNNLAWARNLDDDTRIDPGFGILVGSKYFGLKAEEMVDLLAAIRDTSKVGAEYFSGTKKKAAIMMEEIGDFDY